MKTGQLIKERIRARVQYLKTFSLTNGLGLGLVVLKVIKTMILG